MKPSKPSLPVSGGGGSKRKARPSSSAAAAAASSKEASQREQQARAVKESFKKQKRAAAAAGSTATAVAAPLAMPTSAALSAAAATATSAVTSIDWKHKCELQTMKLREYATNNGKLAEVNVKLEAILVRIRAVLACPISMQDMTAPVVFDGCQHVYQYSSIVEWCRKRVEGNEPFNCPLCRRDSAVRPADMPISLPLTQLRAALYPNEKLDWSRIMRPRGTGSNVKELATAVPSTAAAPFSQLDKGRTAEDIKAALQSKRQLFKHTTDMLEVWSTSFMEAHVSRRLYEFIESRTTLKAEDWCELKVSLTAMLDDSRLDALRERIERVTGTPGVALTLTVPPPEQVATSTAPTEITLALRIPVRLK